MKHQEKNAQIAKDWRSRAVSPLKWEPCENQAGAVQGEAGGYFAKAIGFERRVYLKPTKPHADAQGHARAAREKIAADLASDLGLSVPPAQLTTRDNPPPNCEAAVVVSLVMYPRQWPWELVKGYQVDESPLGAALARVLSGCSPFLVFNTWLCQTDHHDHPHNIVWGYNPEDLSDSEIVFLDYSNSMGFDGSWANDGWKRVALAPFPTLMRGSLDNEQAREALERIENLSESVIESIVDRIPGSHLSEEQKKVLTEGLVGRRELLRQAFADLILARQTETSA